MILDVIWILHVKLVSVVVVDVDGLWTLKL
jgi:hypothetical protein